MNLDDYFDFLAPDDIRIKGTRIGIETVLYDFIHCRETPEAIARRYRTLTLEQVYATVLYYLHNKEVVSTYLADWLEWSHQQRRMQEATPSPLALRIRQLKAERALCKDADPLSIG
jgi:uncharacterized protein (DUF433 family)